MPYSDQYNAYHKANQTVSEINQVIMLYEGAINFIEKAKEAIRENDFEKRYNLINKAISIVTGLNSCLSFNDKTDDVANALDQYYQSIDMRLLYIQCDNSIDSCNEVIDDLRVMLNAWKDVVKETNEAKAQETEQVNIGSNPSENDGKHLDIEINA
jgi:flagellar protein FliS